MNVQINVLDRIYAPEAPPLLAFDYHTPEIFTAVPALIATAGGTLVEIHGRHFGNVSNGVVATIGADICNKTTLIHDGLIECEAGPGFGIGRVVGVQIGSETMLNTSVTVSYASPVITRADPALVNARGGDVHFYGRGFGATQPQHLAIAFDGEDCAQFSWISDSHFIARVPPGIGSVINVSLSVYNQSTSSTGLVAYASPLIYSAQPLMANTSGGIMVTLSGKNFGDASQTIGVPLNVSVGGRWASVVEKLSDSRIKFLLPEGCGREPIVVVAGDQRGPVAPAEEFFYIYATPEIVQLTPNSSMSTIGGTIVYIHGKHLNLLGNGSASSVVVNVVDAFLRQRNCTGIHRISDDLLSCRAPPGVGANVTFYVSVNGLRSVRTQNSPCNLR